MFTHFDGSINQQTTYPVPSHLADEVHSHLTLILIFAVTQLSSGVTKDSRSLKLDFGYWSGNY